MAGCQDYNGRGFDSCALGYGAGFAIPVNNSKQQIAMTTLYKVGFQSGLRNDTVTTLTLKVYVSRGMMTAIMLFHGATRISTTLDIIGVRIEHKARHTSDDCQDADRAGDCSFTPVDWKKSNACEDGWKAAWKKYSHFPLP